MIRLTLPTLLSVAALLAAPFSSAAQAAASNDAAKSRAAGSKSSKATSGKSEAKSSADAGKKAKTDPKAKAAAKPALLANYGDWGAFLAQSGRDKTCYALASPKDRTPSGLQRDKAYVFISNRPAENVRNEISIIMGFAMKDGGEAQAEVANTRFDLVAKGTNAWIKNPAEEGHFIAAMKKSGKLIVKAPSIKGNVTTDTYVLSGFSQALDRVQKECP